MDISKTRKEDMCEIIDFYYFIEEYGHIYQLDEELLNSPFSKIKEGIDEIRKLVDDSYGL